MAARRNIVGGKGTQSSSVTVPLDLRKKLERSGAPPELLGMAHHTGNMFSNIAHRTETMKRFDNLVNNSVDSQIYLQIKDANGDPIVTPFMMNGKQYYPGENGSVRVANGANVKIAKQIRDYQENKTDKIMELCILGDDIACYVLGVDPADWTKWCGKDGKPPANISPDAEWSKELKEENCTIEYIESLVDGSISQTRALSKLRKIVKCFLNNVNLEDFDDVEERKADMSKGVNNATSAKDEIKDQVLEAKDVVAGGYGVQKK